MSTLHTTTEDDLVQRIYDVEAREEILSKEPQLDLAATVIEGNETGRRSAGILSVELQQLDKLTRLQ